VHSFYRASQPSGENILVQAELHALRRAGFEVELFSVRSPETTGTPELFRTAARVAAGGGRHPLEKLQEFGPDLVHIHNLFPGFGRRWVRHLSRFVVTVHNYRFACANGTLERAGSECRLCLGGSAVHGLRYGCYQNSRVATLPVTLAIVQGNPVLDHARLVLAPSDRLARELTRARPSCGGKTVTHAPFLPDALTPPAVPGRAGRHGDTWLFAGRISPEKGLYELLRDWPSRERLTVIGDGPDKDRCTALARTRRLPVDFVGPLPRDHVLRWITHSLGVVVASRAPETFGLNYLEALAAGRPVVARRGTTPAALAEAERTGCIYTDGTDLAEALERARLGEFPAEKLREVFSTKYSEASFVHRAQAVYEHALEVTM
jgi:glycosyltransferase involved in cell wall biosynthesis